MKKPFLLLFILSAFISCSNSPEKKARDLIEQDLKMTMNDWSSYEFVKITDVDKTFTTFDSSQIAADMMRQKNIVERKIRRLELLNRWVVSNPKEKQLNIDSLKNLNNFMKEYPNEYSKKESEFVEIQNGWYVVFTFRGNNSLGAQIISTESYYFNMDITKIIKQHS